VAEFGLRNAFGILGVRRRLIAGDGIFGNLNFGLAEVELFLGHGLRIRVLYAAVHVHEQLSAARRALDQTEII
jgi:hypothetical protein